MKCDIFLCVTNKHIKIKEMYHYMKKLISLFLVLAMTALVAASCGTKNPPVDGTTTPGGNQPEQTSATSSTTNIFTPADTNALDTRVVARYKKVYDDNFDAKILIDENNNEYGITITRWRGTGEDLVIPSSLTFDGKEYPVIQIGTRANGAIAGQNLKTLTIPSSVKLICENAFMSSVNLERVVIEEGLEEIGSFAFWNSGVEIINLPASLKKIGDYSFSSCTNIKSLIIPASVTEIGEQAFVGCASLETVSLPRIFEGRQNEIFLGCSKVTVSYVD